MSIKTSVRTLLGRGALAMLGASAAQAQDAPSSSGPAEPALEEIVVTGTLIRGVAPTGTNVVGLSNEDIAATGASNSMQVLANVPQVTNAFNRTPSLPIEPGISIVRPNLRSLDASGASTTLVLMDGHRMIPAGILQTSPDADVIPPGVLDRIEIVPDGGSAIYGSDAVGGVINFITRESVDGIELSGDVGFADGYETYNAELTAGRDWGVGSAYLSYVHAHHDAIFGRDRDYVRQTTPDTGSCAPGTVIVGGASYALPDRAPGTTSTCDITDNLSIYPRETRDSFFAAFNHDLSDAVSLDVKAFYTRREATSFLDLNDSSAEGGTAQSVTITAANPFYVPIGPGDPGVQTVNFSYAGVQDPRATNDLDEYQITPRITVDLGGDWQLRALGAYGESEVTTHNPRIDAAAQAAALAATTTAAALNPYDVAATSPTVLNNIYREFYGSGEQEFINGRVIVDGSLFQIPGGAARLAAGAEYIEESLVGAFGVIVPGQTDSLAPASGDRTVKSAFAELVLPIVGESNAASGVQSLTLSASGRYDDYSDFGDTFNPKFGITYEPVEGLTLRGNWGTSFNAPSLADTNSPDSRVVVLPISPFLDPADSPANFFRPTVALAGGNPDLKPQEADTWSFGLDIRPTDDLLFSATYYNISLTDQIALIPFTSGSVVFGPEYASFVTRNPMLEQVQAAAGDLPVDGPALESLYGGLGPYVLLDLRRNNLAVVEQDGVDFNVNYARTTGFGGLDAGISGTYTLSRDVAPIAGAPAVDQLDSGFSVYSVAVSFGAQIGRLYGSVSLNHSAGYDLDPPETNPLFGAQSDVEAFDTVDLFFRYDFDMGGLLEHMALTLNVDNALDEDPPFYNSPSLNGYANGATLGRLVKLGVRTKF